MGGIAQPFNRTKPKTPSMANPLATGLAKAPAQNMKNIRKAAQGGIVGFAGAEGSVVPDTTPENLKKDFTFGIDYKTLIGTDLDTAAKDVTDKGFGKATTSGIEKTLDRQKVDEMFSDRLKLAKEKFGYTDAQIEEMSDLYQRRKNIGLAQLDPDKLRKQAIPQILAAMAGGTSLASAGRRGVQAGAQIREKQEGAGLKQLTDQETSFRNLLSDITENKKSQFTAAQEKEKLESGEYVAGLSAGVNLTNSQYNMLTDKAQLYLTAERANQDAFGQYVNSKIQEQLQLHMNAEDNSIRFKIANLQAETEEKIRKSQMELENLRLKEASKDRLLASLEGTKSSYEKIMADNHKTVMGFYSKELQQLALKRDSEPENSPERIGFENEYNNVIATINESANLLNTSALQAIADLNAKINNFSIVQQ